MIHHPTLIACFQSLVGWRSSPVKPARDEWALPENLTISESGLYFNDAHEMIRIEVIDDVKSEHEPMYLYLQRITDDAIIKVINGFTVTLSGNGLAKALLENRHVVKGAGQINSKEVKQGRFVGFQITLRERNYVSTMLRRIALQLDTVQAGDNLDLYIYSDSSFAPLHIIPLAHSQRNSLQWFDLENKVLASINSDNKFYIGYYEDDLTGQAIKKEFTGGPCGCSDDPYSEYSKHFSVKPFSVPASALDADRNLFDTEQITQEQSNFGLNFEPVVYCDLSRVICQNKHLFAKAIQLMVASRILSAIIDTPEVNQITTRDKQQLYDSMKGLQLQLFGGKDEVGNYYKGEMGKLSVDFTGLDEVCLPKKQYLSMATIRR